MASKLKLRVAARFLASIFNGNGTNVRKDGLATYVDIDYTQFGAPLGSVDPTADQILVYNTVTGVYNVATLTALIAASSGVRVITAAGDVNVGASDGLIILNKTVGAPTNVNLPLAGGKVGKVKIVDFKGDAATNNITVVTASPETFNGAATSWVISANGGSVVCDPIPAVGYGI
jgi:hypothetical protein